MIHARSSARKYGGTPECYLDIHQFMDSSKSTMADVRHRAIFHFSLGCFIVEQIFGVERTNSEGRKYSPRDIAEDHCIEDLGFIPSVERWLGNMTIQAWMGGPGNKRDREVRTKQISYIDEDKKVPDETTVDGDWIKRHRRGPMLGESFKNEDLYYDVDPKLREG